MSNELTLAMERLINYYIKHGFNYKKVIYSHEWEIIQKFNDNNYFTDHRYFRIKCSVCGIYNYIGDTNYRYEYFGSIFTLSSLKCEDFIIKEII